TELPHRFRVENIDDARVACGNIESLVDAIEKHDIWGAAQRILSQHLPGTRIERDQLTRIAGAEQAMRVGIEIEPVRANRGDRECARDAVGLPYVDKDHFGGGIKFPKKN